MHSSVHSSVIEYRNIQYLIFGIIFICNDCHEIFQVFTAMSDSEYLFDRNAAESGLNSILINQSAARVCAGGRENETENSRSESPGTKIKLDIGGCKFTTTITTLQRFPHTMLGAMFSGRHALQLDADGYFFIDRDGRHFHHVLNFLRDPEHFTGAEVPAAALAEVTKEAAYYGLFEVMWPHEAEAAATAAAFAAAMQSAVGTITPTAALAATTAVVAAASERRRCNCGNISKGRDLHLHLHLLRSTRNGWVWYGSCPGLNITLQPIQWCRTCGVGYLTYDAVFRFQKRKVGIHEFARGRKVSQVQPHPSPKCLKCGVLTTAV